MLEQLRFHNCGTALRWAVVASLGATGCGRIGYDPVGLGDPRVDAGEQVPRADAQSTPDRFLPPDATVDDAIGDVASLDVRPNDASPPSADAEDVGVGADAAADASCPSNLENSVTGSTATRGGIEPGFDYSDSCPPGQALIGYSGTVDTTNVPTVGQLSASCGLMVIDPATCRVSVLPGASLPQRGSATGTSFQQKCPANQVVVGLRGRSGSNLDQIGLQCASFVVGVDGTVMQGPLTQLPPAGGSGGVAFDDGCAPGPVAIGHAVRIREVGELVINFALICATVRATP